MAGDAPAPAHARSHEPQLSVTPNQSEGLGHDFPQEFVLKLHAASLQHQQQQLAAQQAARMLVLAQEVHDYERFKNFQQQKQELQLGYSLGALGVQHGLVQTPSPIPPSFRPCTSVRPLLPRLPLSAGDNVEGQLQNANLLNKFYGVGFN
jgi:hypothetical protein